MGLLANTFTALTVIISAMHIQPALGNDYVVLGSKPASKLQSIGKGPPKRKKDLDLGPLRTASAVLPAATRTLEERMRMRVNRALDRKEAVSNALRNTEDE